MQKPAHAIEIFLQPGDFYFGDKNTRIRTVLGSCVSITLWHPKLHIGGMCHYMLPFRPVTAAQLDGRYAEEALQLFLREIRTANTRPSEYRVRVLGGGDMFPTLIRKNRCEPHTNREDIGACRSVSCKNAAIARLLLASHGFEIEAEDLGGDGHRQVIFDIWSGHVLVRKAPVVIAC